jgi:hypothetical protein
MQTKLQHTWQWLRNERRTLWIEYGGLALVILLPLVVPGYILTLDLVMTPHFAWPSELTNTFPLQAALWALHFILPGDVIEKLLLFVILLFSGVGMHLLMRTVNAKAKFTPEVWRIAVYFGGIFYMINPFTYSRFMAGQWMFLLGYAMVPFFLRALLKFFSAPAPKALVSLAVWAFAIVSASIHHIGILLLLSVAVPTLASVLGYWRNAAHIRQYALWSGIGLLSLAIVNAYWLVPAATGQGSLGVAVASMNDVHFKAFATNGTGAFGAVGAVIRLQGFWVEARQLYVLPQAMAPAWGILFLLIWSLVAIGAIKALRSYRLLVSLAISAVAAGIILSATPLVAWLSHGVPFMAGYREPHKFASLIALGYAMLGVFGTAFAIQWAGRRFKETGEQAATVACLLLPIAVTPTMLWGFAGQLSPRQYPSEWYDMNRIIKTLPAADRILFLPWHQYMNYSFSGRIIANPAAKFFEAPMIVADNPEFMNLPPTQPNPDTEAIAAVIHAPSRLLSVLRTHHVRYILLADEGDARTYASLDTLSGLRIVAKNARLKLYEVKQ